jgi:NAD(P)-dependent dehydrogenase (short-subunit alcohol dehydrogenase family)
MGAAYERGFLAEGAKVVAADLSWDGVEAFWAEVETAGGLPLVMDVTDTRAIVVPLVLDLASQDASQITGRLFDVVQWNSAHGLGGRECWEVPT